MKTAKGIAAALHAATHLTDDVMADFDEYRRAKRASGAPVDLEIEVAHAATACLAAESALREHLRNAAREATEALAELDAAGSKLFRIWFTLDGRANAEQLGRRLQDCRERFNAIVGAWASVADRVVATPEEQAAKAAEKRQRAIGILAARPVRDLRAMAKAAGVKVGTDREEIAAALVDGGHMEGLVS